MDYKCIDRNEVLSKAETEISISQVLYIVIDG